MKRKKTIKPRVWELDVLRGLSILMVIWDHFMIDCAYIFGKLWIDSGNLPLTNLAHFAQTYHNSDLRAGGWITFTFIFFFVSGTCVSFSNNNLMRGLKLLFVSLLVSLVTYILELVGLGNVIILFGVLHCLSLCILIFAGLDFLSGFIVKLFKKINDPAKIKKYITSALCLVVFTLGLVFHFLYNTDITLPDFPATSYTGGIKGMFIYTKDWWQETADYFPLLPFLSYFMLGAALSPFLYSNKKSLLPKLDGKWHYFLSFPGRYSLWIYLSLQVILFPFLGVLTWTVTGVFPF